jgi:hypothetical protein
MSNSEELARQERRRQLIERLNKTEEMFDLARTARRPQMTEEELEIELEREHNYSRRGFGQIYVGLGPGAVGGGDFGGGGGGGGGDGGGGG